MATAVKKMFRGAASTSSTTLYTAPSTAGNRAVITSIVVANTSSSNATYSLSVGGTSIATTVVIAGNDSAILGDIKIVMENSETITGLASATSVNFIISGIEIT